MTFQEIRARAQQVRNIALEDVLLAVGATRDRHDKAKWHTAQGMLSVNGPKFMNWNQAKGGGGAIDLAMHLNDFDFKAAVHWLWSLFPNLQPSTRAQSSQKPRLQLPSRDDRQLPRVQRYLVHQRKLPSAILEPLIETGLLFADRHANAVFLLLGKDNLPVGAELRGTSTRPWRGMAPGSDKDAGYFSIHAPQARTIVLCESAIDAISCFSIHPDCCCTSTSGARPNPKWLPFLLFKGRQILCGFDADPTGDKMARAMSDLHPTIIRHRPPKHDWNDVLAAPLQYELPLSKK